MLINHFEQKPIFHINQGSGVWSFNFLMDAHQSQRLPGLCRKLSTGTGNASFSRASHQADSRVSQRRHHLWYAALSHLRVIFPLDYISYPMALVLDYPMLSHQPQQLVRRSFLTT